MNIGGYLIWQILPSGYIGCYLNWRFFFGPSQISQLKSPANINRLDISSQNTHTAYKSEQSPSWSGEIPVLNKIKHFRGNYQQNKTKKSNEHAQR